MLRIEEHGDVIRVILSSTISRAIGYGVSAYFTRGLLVDTGFPAVGAEVAAWAARTRPRGMILTHSHEDHAGNVERLTRTGIPVALADATLAALVQPHALGFYRQVTWGTPPRLRSPLRRFFPDDLRLVPTPGHSDDHHVVWDAEHETLFSGDLFLGVKVRVAHPGENLRQLVRSLRSAAALRPRRMFDAHRGLVPSPTDALLAKAAWIEETIDAIERRAERGWTDRAIARSLLGREDLTHYVSRGKMSKINFVRAALTNRG
jgi:glyoxylase-like metal-dependent hydrolase (beta-lactamase superfamily II)